MSKIIGPVVQKGGGAVVRAIDRSAYVPPTSASTNAEAGLGELLVDSKTGRLLTHQGTRVALDFEMVADAGGTYAAGDVLRGVRTFSHGTLRNGGILESMILIDGDAQKVPIDVLVLSQPGSTSQWPDNGPPNMLALMRRNIIGVVRFATADYADFGFHSVAAKHLPVGLFTSAVDTEFAFVAVTRAAATWNQTLGGAGQGLMMNVVIRTN